MPLALGPGNHHFGRESLVIVHVSFPQVKADVPIDTTLEKETHRVPRCGALLGASILANLLRFLNRLGACRHLNLIG